MRCCIDFVPTMKTEKTVLYKLVYCFLLLILDHSEYVVVKCVRAERLWEAFLLVLNKRVTVSSESSSDGHCPN